MKTDNSTDYLLDPGNFDSAKDARNHKNWLLLKALWFWMTMVMFFGVCVLLSFSDPTKDTIGAFIISAFMGLFYLGVAFAQTMLWWEDDLDGLLPREGGWRF